MRALVDIRRRKEIALFDFLVFGRLHDRPDGVQARIVDGADRKPFTLIGIIRLDEYRAAAHSAPTQAQRRQNELLAEKEELLLSREGEARLHRLLHTLPEPYREIFTLRVFAELDFRQLGELFHKSDTWARVTFYRAKVKLQEAIRRDEYEQV